MTDSLAEQMVKEGLEVYLFQILYDEGFTWADAVSYIQAIRLDCGFKTTGIEKDTPQSKED